MCTTNTHTSRCGGYRVVVVSRSYIGPSIYIGPQRGRDAASVLANPRSLHAGWTRGETLAHYRRELRAVLDHTVAVAHWDGRELSAADRAAKRAEMRRLFQLLTTQGEIVLRCFCAPQACHGDEIAAILLEELVPWLMRRPAATALSADAIAA